MCYMYNIMCFMEFRVVAEKMLMLPIASLISLSLVNDAKVIYYYTLEYVLSDTRKIIVAS